MNIQSKPRVKLLKACQKMEDTNQDTYYEAQNENPFAAPAEEAPKTVFPIVKSDLED